MHNHPCPSVPSVVKNDPDRASIVFLTAEFRFIIPAETECHASPSDPGPFLHLQNPSETPTFSPIDGYADSHGPRQVRAALDRLAITGEIAPHQGIVAVEEIVAETINLQIAPPVANAG